MGLREKVALFIMVVLIAQLMYGECGPRTKKVKNSRDISQKPRRSKLRKHSKIVPKSEKKDDDVVRRFNFPEVEYSLPMSQPSPIFSKHDFDLQSGQVSLKTDSKSDMNLPNKSKNRKLKINRKNNKAEATATKIPQIPPYPEIETSPYTNYKDFFPSVDYPLDATDLWTPYYWNRTPPAQPELKFNVKDLSVNTKATEEISKFPKGPVKDAAITKIVNSIINTETTYKSKKKLNTGTKNDTCSIVTNDFKPSINDLNDPVCLMNTDKVSCDEVNNNSEYNNYNEPSTVSHFISPLTTLSPVPTSASGNAYGKDTASTSPAAEKEEVDEMPDDMGYTLMYPEVISYVSTSTTAPLLVDNIDMWMYPELDNHTLNTYSDEVDQCYILVP